jgi:sec-independent protein translocase protein TatB
VFGISFSELVVIAVIALLVVGPQKLPTMLRSLGQWIARLRRLTTEVRAQTGIDEVLREEGIDGVHELRALLRGEITASRARARDPYEDTIEIDEGQEYPAEGPDAAGALPDDLLQDDDSLEPPASGDEERTASPDAPPPDAPPIDEAGGTRS